MRKGKRRRRNICESTSSYNNEMGKGSKKKNGITKNGFLRLWFSLWLTRTMWMRMWMCRCILYTRTRTNCKRFIFWYLNSLERTNKPYMEFCFHSLFSIFSLYLPFRSTVFHFAIPYLIPAYRIENNARAKKSIIFEFTSLHSTSRRYVHVLVWLQLNWMWDAWHRIGREKWFWKLIFVRYMQWIKHNHMLVRVGVAGDAQLLEIPIRISSSESDPCAVHAISKRKCEFIVASSAGERRNKFGAFLVGSFWRRCVKRFMTNAQSGIDLSLLSLVSPVWWILRNFSVRARNVDECGR